MSDIDGLFPELSGILGAFDTPPPVSDPLSTDVDHSGVTDEQIDAFFRANPGIRPLNPLISGQQATTAPFVSGSTGIPPAGGVEADGGGPAIPGQPGAPAVPPPVTPPPAPSAPPAAPSPIPSPVAVPPALDPATISQLQALQAELTRDPELRQKVADHFVGRAAPQVSQPPVAPAPQSAPAIQPPVQYVQPGVPPVQIQTSTPPPNLDLDDPSIAALWNIVQSQQQQLAATQQTVQSAAATSQAQVAQQMNSYYETASTGFATKYSLESSDIEHLSGVAARMGVLPQLMSGVDPLTGVPVRPDPIIAIDRALEIAYFTDPTYRQREWERQGKARKEDAQRQQRLAAVSGSSASVPRTTPAPVDAAGRQQSMLAEVGQMLNGSWNDPAAN